MKMNVIKIVMSQHKQASKPADTIDKYKLIIKSKRTNVTTQRERIFLKTSSYYNWVLFAFK